MRRFFLISLISIHILGNTEVSQLLKLPNLFAHYLEHHRINPGISFSQFLTMHYGGDDGTDADNDRDNQLPCHDFHHATINTICYQLQETPVVSNLRLPARDHYQLLLLNQEIPGYTATLYRPPRFA